ncbi:hypothetical protein F4556_003989 [Kitasatospora gansuensis]|uniref:Uncharacterized protein n=1 Tax=Kitasatospora gansuensis TaxID=258050 RepID=A0A7W7SDH2_9ACTN|nr:hypothetical protein [Kitasatospora gansuensis]MBB4948454.1 hypothetical protein [Kitasatospora gansuensis]
MTIWFEQRVIGAYRTALLHDRGAATAECRGQLRLERHLMDCLLECVTDLGPLGGGAFGLRSATAGPACLHLVVEPSLLGHLLHRLCPAVLTAGSDERLAGVPGLRLTEDRPDRVELRHRDGHGRLVLHPDRAGRLARCDWDDDFAAVYTSGDGRCSCLASAPHHDHHRLRHAPELHPAEWRALRRPGDSADDAIASRELRRAARQLPGVPNAHRPQAN